MPRRTADETRELLIRTGIELLHERGVTAGVQHVRLKDVLQRANLTTGAAYRLWPDQSAFHHDLAVAATAHRDDRPLTRTLAAIRDVVDGGQSIHEVVRRGAAAHIEGLSTGVEADGRTPSTFLITLALRAAATHSDELREVSRARHHGSIESFTELYAMLLQVYGRQMRAPFTIDQMASAIAAVGEGFALQIIEGEPHPLVMLAAPTDDGDGSNGPGGSLDDLHEWTVFGVVLDAIVERFTEPVAETAADPRPSGRLE